MSLTSNFDFCVQLGIASVKEIFHLAFKSEDRYPHNIGPFERDLGGHLVTVVVRALDDEDAAADLSFQDEKHILFSLPMEITAVTPDAPDPALSSVTLRARVAVPAELTSWEEAGEEVLGLSFFGVTAADVSIESLEGVPPIDVSSFAAAVHARYEAIQHVYEYLGNVLVLYDGNRDNTLTPPNDATPFEIQVELLDFAGDEYLKITAPIHVNVPLGVYGVYESYGRVIFHRLVERSDATIRVDMTVEPAAPELASVVELDNAHPARDLIIANLQPMLVLALNGFGLIEEPGFTDVGAAELIAQESAAYLAERRYPVYSPKSGDPDEPLSTPVGFLLVAEGILAILLNRRDDSVADAAPDPFLGGNELALAVGRAKVDEFIAAAIEDEFPDLDSGAQEISTDEGTATLHELNVVPSDPGSHDEDVGHLWVTGEAEVHIDCWPDPDVSFEGPIYVNAQRVDDEDGCGLVIEPVAGEFDIDQSCCDVLLELMVPIVGIVIFLVIESTIESVGGELIGDITEAQGDIVEPIPPVINGIAEVTACLTALNVTSQGFILPGDIEIRRLGTSFEDRAADHDLPRP